MAERLIHGHNKSGVARRLLAAGVLLFATSDTRTPDTIERSEFEAALDAHDISVMTANVHGFEHYSQPGASNVPELLTAIESEKPDVICFQEFNPDRERTIISQLVNDGYNVVFTSTVRQGYRGLREGNAIASKGTITTHEAIALPGSNESIPRQVLIAEIATDIGNITLANTHLGLEYGERWQQASFIEGLNMDKAINCGDYNENFTLPNTYGYGSGYSTPHEKQPLLSPYKTQATSMINNQPTHVRGGLIDRVSTDCGQIISSAQLRQIGSDHSAPIGRFDLSDCFAVSAQTNP